MEIIQVTYSNKIRVFQWSSANQLLKFQERGFSKPGIVMQIFLPAIVAFLYNLLRTLTSEESKVLGFRAPTALPELSRF